MSHNAFIKFKRFVGSSRSNESAGWREAVGCFVSLLLLMFAPAGAFGGDVAVGAEARFINITPYLDYYEDKTGEFDITDVSSGEIFKQFTPVRQPLFHAGIAPSVYWFRVRLAFSSVMASRGLRLLLEIPTVNSGEITLYIPDFTHSSGFSAESAPSLKDSANAEFLFRNVVFPISSNMSGRTIFFKIKSEAPFSNSFYIWEDGAYRKEESRRTILFALCCGIMFGACLFILLVSGGRRKTLTACFSGIVLLWCLFMFNVEGYSALYVSNPQLIPLCNVFVLTAIGLLSLLLCIIILDLKNTLPKFYRLTRVLMLVPLISGALAMIFQNYSMSLALAAISGTLICLFKTTAAVLQIRQRYQPSFWYLAHLMVLYGSLLLYFGNGIFWPALPVAQALLKWGLAVSTILICAGINLIQGVMPAHKHGEEGLYYDDPYDISTGLYSRTYFISRFTEEINHSRRMRQPLSLLLVNLDNLQKTNEDYGVLFSDQLIVSVGEIIKENALRFSAGGRLDGGHFVMQLPEVSLGDALAVAEKIRDDFSSIRFNPELFSSKPKNDSEEMTYAGDQSGLRGQALSFTVCIGVVEVLPEETGWEQVAKRVQEELNNAKALGPNNISPSPDLKNLL